ncbi:dienelactone hydrolase [Asanoa ishikariensis]|uniref:Dienelactone hydrolase n=1 Tax=Asanoa ishikariensis TaxID=137265 RepID=A0A1H3S107_9ACTN|nr:dienelactone hydrolase family protein [Asanoa ishikariensis]GIF66625.1 dienelactone hydrolase [Asanoa ishikariensis]SDZ31467.1 Dienelactone hydrolase [Asanoa ishikariensis]
MAEVVLFHHAQGLTAGVTAFAEALRAAGHTVHTPDLYEGNTFDTLDEGLSYAQKVGFDTVIERGVAAAGDLPADVVHAGFSLGGMPAQQLAQTRPSRGALLFHTSIWPTEFGAGWPADVPVRIHAMENDPFFAEEGGDIDAARAIVAAAADGELFLYPGDQHLFSDVSLPSYDAEATALLLRRTLEFLASR